MASSKRSKAPRSKSARLAAAPPPRAGRALTAAIPPLLAPGLSLAHTAAHAGPGAESPSWLRDVLWTRAAVAPPQPPRAESPRVQPPVWMAPRVAPPGIFPPRTPVEIATPAEAAPAAEAPASAPGSPSASPTLSLEERRHLVAKLAYVRAEGIGFGRSNPLEDWLWAEQEVRRMLGSRAA